MAGENKGNASSTNYRSLISAKRFAQFLSVGVIGAIVDNALLVALVEGAALAPVTAAVGAKESSILLMFLINDNWTFSDKNDGGFLRRLRRLVKSNVVRSGGAVVGIGTLFVLHNWFDMWYLAANVVGIGVGFLFNYTFESVVTWRVHDR